MNQALVSIQKKFFELMGIISVEELVSNYELIKRIMGFKRYFEMI